MWWDLNPAKTQFETPTHEVGTQPSQNPWFVVSGRSEVQVLDVSSQKEFSERQNGR